MEVVLKHGNELYLKHKKFMVKKSKKIIEDNIVYNKYTYTFNYSHAKQLIGVEATADLFNLIQNTINIKAIVFLIK